MASAKSGLRGDPVCGTGQEDGTRDPKSDFVDLRRQCEQFIREQRCDLFVADRLMTRLLALVDDQTQQIADLQLSFNASNDHVGKLIADLDAARASLAAQALEIRQLRELITWTLGESETDEFPSLPEDWPSRKFYWRHALRTRFAALAAPPEAP